MVKTQPACSVGTPSALQRNAIQIASRWWADSGPLFDVYWEQTEFEDI